MAQVLSVTHYLQDVHNKRDLTAHSDEERVKLESKFSKFSFVINREDDESVNDVLTKKIELVKRIRAERDSEDIATTAALFAPFVDKYKQLHKAYTVSLQSYKHAIAAGRQEYDENVLLEIADKMIMAAVFEVAIFRERHTYQEQLKVLDQVLFDISSKNPNAHTPEDIFDSRAKVKLNLYNDNIPKPSTYAAKIRSTHNDWNIGRFFILRFWRWLNLHLKAVLASCKEYIEGLKAAKDNGLGIFFSYISWVFFIPRITLNIKEIFQTIFGFLPIFGSAQLPELEQAYGWFRRLQLKLKEVGFEMANDLMWFSSGIINCFSLAGTLPIIGVYIMVAAQAYDFFVMMIRNYVERGIVNSTNEDLRRIQKENGLEDSNYFLDNLNNRIQFDKKVLLYAIFNFALLLMCITLMTPAFGSISPIIPVVASIITVIIALFRGVFIFKFRGEGENFNPALINSKKNAGLVTLHNDETGKFDQAEDIEDYLKSNKLFEAYKKGVVIVKADQDPSCEGDGGDRVYRYNAAAENVLVLIDESQDMSSFIREKSSKNIGERAVRLSEDEFKKVVVEEQSEDNGFWSSMGRNISSVMSFGV